MKFQILNNFLKIAIRNLLRNKLFSFISIAGFTVGLTVFIHLMTFVHNEMSYDSFHKNKDRIFRAVIYTPDDKEYYGNYPVALSIRMKESMPQIENAVNYLDKDLEIKVNGEFIKEKITFADPGFFKMFSFRTLAGNPYTFGNNPNGVFVTQAFAEKYFGSSNPLGKIISTKITERTIQKNIIRKNPKGEPVHSYKVEEKSYDFLIEGIVENPPDNTVMKFNVLVPFINAEKMSMRFNKEDISPGEFLPTFFVMLKKGTDKALLEAEFKSMVKPLIRNEAYKPELRLYPIEKIHFSTEIGPFSSIKPVSPLSVLVLSIIGIAILLIVSINYINLTISQSSHRFKEIGIRKVSGASRSEVVYQFIWESFFMILISMLISLLLSVLTLPVFNRITGKELTFSFGWGSIALAIILISAALSLLAGAYSAIVMSGLDPVKIFKGNQKLSGSGILAKIFVTTQFVLAIVLISGAIIVNSQYDFFMKADLGYNKDNVLLIRTNDMFGRMISDNLLWVYRNQALNLPGIRSASMSSMVLGGNGHIVAQLRFDYGSKFIPSYVINFNEEMIPAMGFKIIEGRNFSSAYSSDSLNSIIVNEEFVKEIGIRNPIGKHLKFSFINKKDVQIVGVVKNFHYMPLHEKILPVAIFKAGNRSSNECIYVKMSPRNMQKTVVQLKQTWEKLIPGQVFDYVFLDNKLADLYKNENRWKNIITYSSAVAIFFACMGLFGLVFYQAEKRTKEIGIRKVLGASTFSIIRSLVNEFLILIAIAIIIGCSVSYYFANKWLKNFAYHIDLNAWIFILAALLVTVIVISTILIIASRVASTNSAENLRYE
ncbi:MAG TPA: FtsX-like permease family protein [Ignavibacteriales bacterium]|nr:FtsX-like permease family protein [Ignavibacteriales bacterium]